MNVVIVSGRLAANAVVFGNNQETLKFSVACKSGYDSAAQQPRVEFIPCVMFRAPEKLRSLLASEGKGKPVELQGRIATSSFDKNGETRYSTEVIADLKEFQLLRLGDGKQATAQHPVSNQYQNVQKGERAYATNYHAASEHRGDIYRT